MSKRFHNRRPSEWRAVLAAFGFTYTSNDGDDQVWKHDENPNVRILIPQREKDVVIISTASYMVRAIERVGVMSRKEILTWWKANGYGD